MNGINLSSMGLISAALMVGCVADAPALEEHAGQPAITLNKIVLNGILANKLTAAKIAENPLATGRTETSLIANPVSDPMLSTAEGRDYFSYIVSCAMPAGEVVKAAVAGVEYEFSGSIGLVPDWEFRALSTSEKRWVSACLLARVNAYGVSVSISLRGDHGALLPSAEESSAYGVVEGAFYGNLFVAENQKLEMSACRGAAQAAGESGQLMQRDCTEPAGNGLTQCGFKYAGDCSDYSPATPSAYACSSMTNGLYQNCHTMASTGRWAAGSERSEVITVFVGNQ